MDDFRQIDISDEVDKLSDRKKVIALERALRKLDIDCWYEDDGTLTIDTDDMYSDEISNAFSEELKKTVINESLQALIESGYAVAEVDGDSGELKYRLTDKGKAEAEKIIKDSE